MNDKTYKTLLLTVLVIVFLILLHFLPKIKIAGTELREINILSDLSPQQTTLQDVLPRPAQPKATQLKDKDGRLVSFKESWPKGTEPIVDFSGGKAGGMDAFYEKINNLAKGITNGRPVRIAYYGDSFIEGDVLLEHLREELQKKYGGWGVGWLDAGNELNQYKHTVTHKFTGLVEHMVMKRKSYDVALAGLAERYYTCSGPVQISLAPFILPEFPQTGKWRITQLYLRAPRGADITMKFDGNVQRAFQLSPSPRLQVVQGASPTSHAQLSVRGGGAVLFGTSQEAKEGVIIDNFSMRGTNGQSLGKLPVAMLSEFARVRPYDLIVLQYGVNAVNEQSDAPRLKKYIEGMRIVVNNFRKAFPQTSILIVSAPDRGSKSSPDGTMHQVEMLVSYQENLAAECKVGFYNLLNAMGGPGTMKRIVDSYDMGSKDYVHINHKGGKYVSGRIFKSIVAGQKNYGRRMGN